MGTRHLIQVVCDKKTKVAQYGQWDGYPEGQGETISKFIRETLSNKDNLDKFKEKIRQLRFLTDKDMEEENNKKYTEQTFPMEFHRDTGADILNMIWEKDIKVVANSSDFFDDRTFCEWAYTIDLDTQELKIFTPPILVVTFQFEHLKDDTMEILQETIDKVNEIDEEI